MTTPHAHPETGPSELPPPQTSEQPRKPEPAPPPAPIPLSMTEHAPVGAWASLTFGGEREGVLIEHEGVAEQADLLIGVMRDGQVRTMPFLRHRTGCPGIVVGGGDVVRTMTPCIDEFSVAAEGSPKMTVRVYTPHAALPNPKRSGNLQYATAPGILIDLIVDNTDSDSPASAFFGLNFDHPQEENRGAAGVRLRPMDWSSKTLVGIAESAHWALAAQGVKDNVFTVLAHEAAACVMAVTPAIEPGGGKGGVAIRVPARSTQTLTLAFVLYHQGIVTQGIEGRYLYTAYFPRLEAAANFLISNAQKIRESCASFDGRVRGACPDPQKLQLFARAIRAYEAQTQILDAAGTAYFAVIDKKTGFRNVMDAAADFLPWELYRNPWVIRNLFDLATTSYSYHDKVYFPGDPDSPEQPREGGMSFAHDFGYHTAYTPGPASAEELRGGAPMVTEELLNAIYMLTSYALLADDTPWAKTRLPFARELMTSMENRDSWDPEKRTGILKAESDRGGKSGRAEITALAEAGGSLGAARGNLYLAVKTFCANMMLTTYFQNNNDLHSADYSYAFAQKTAAALVAAFDKEHQFLPANLFGLAPDPREKALAALEPLAVPTYLGLTSTLPEYFPELYNVLKSHAETCLRDGCLNTEGHLRLTSDSPRILPGKAAAVLYVLERLFGIDVQARYPHAWQTVANSPDDSRLLTMALYLKGG